jgi:hypothetical protein
VITLCPGSPVGAAEQQNETGNGDVFSALPFLMNDLQEAENTLAILIPF